MNDAWHGTAWHEEIALDEIISVLGIKGVNSGWEAGGEEKGLCFTTTYMDSTNNKQHIYHSMPALVGCLVQIQT